MKRWALLFLGLGLLLSAPAQAAGRLSQATSPYLLLHADDAIQWHPWGEAALERARREDKPIFLSIGYASCYWCHVLKRTTLTDQRVIEELNRNFVNILVDREERPDVDNHFQEIMWAMTGRRGHPATFILTPDRVPLFAAGYLAPEPEYGEPGLVAVLGALAGEWSGNRRDLLKRAKAGLNKPLASAPARKGDSPRQAALGWWSQAFDRSEGGFGEKPKFPRPNVLSFLLRQGVWRGDKALLENVFRTLDHMAAGGVRDQLGGAFHRYSVDRFWRVPHFEIMLDTNALLALTYLEAYQASAKARYAAVARGILDDLMARFRLGGGGFASGLDAESDGEEGRFYTWTAAEVRSVLGDEEGERFISAYVDPFQGLVGERSVLRILDGPQSLLKTQDMLKASRLRLLKARRQRPAPRRQRPAPRRDDKVLTSWNALAVSAFAKAARILDDSRYLRVATEIMEVLLQGRELVHVQKADGTVFLDDYAFAAQALLDLYETDFNAARLDDARLLMETVIQRFQERPGTAFRFSPLDAPSHIPPRTILDEAGAPSGNAAALSVLHRLALFAAEGPLAEQARAMTRSLGGYLEKSARLAPGLLGALDYTPTEAHEIVIVGNPGDGATRSLLREVNTRLLHGTVVAVIAPDAPEENEAWPLLAARPLIDGVATAYVCKNRLCDLPVNEPAELAAQLDRLVSPATGD